MNEEPLPGSDITLSQSQERRLHPWSWLFVLLQQLKQFIFPLVALLVFGGRGSRGGEWAALGPAIAIGVLVVISVVQYFTYRYRVGRESLSVRDGLLHRTLREIPFARIHNVVVHQSLLHRIFGVAEVRLESAGGQKPEAQMRVLSLADALALENLVKHRGRAAAADTGQAPAADSLLTLPLREVIRLGLISNRGMILVAAAFGAAWQILPEDRMESIFRDGFRQAFGYANHLQLGWLSTTVSVVSLIVVAVLLLRGLSVLLALLQYSGFRLSEEQRRLMVERGLLTRLRTSVAQRRIQAWTLQEGLLHRWFKRRSLRIDTAVAEQQNQGEQRALKELAPIATPAVCDQLVQHLLPQAQWPRQDWRPLPVGAWWRLFVPTAVVVVLLAGVLTWHFGTWGLLALAWLPWSVYESRQHARRAGYALDTQLIAVRGGWWARYWRFAEIDKLQALRLSRSPIDRRCGTASLWLDTAGATGMAPPLRIRFLPEAEARALYEQLSRALARRRLRW
ncbi:PH domain-containing protein [Pseudoxanthomonas wuyuanensis]